MRGKLLLHSLVWRVIEQCCEDPCGALGNTRPRDHSNEPVRLQVDVELQIPIDDLRAKSIAM